MLALRNRIARTLLRTMPCLLLVCTGMGLQAAGSWETLTRPFGPDQVVRPNALAVDGLGNLYVADSGNRRLVVRTPQGVWRVIATNESVPDQVDLGFRISLAADKAGNLYIGDRLNERIMMRTPLGVWIRILSSGDPLSLAVDNSGDLFVTDGTKVRMRTLSGLWSDITSNDTGLNQVSYPVAVTVDGSGNLYVADAGNRQVLMRTPNGIWSVIASEGSIPDQASDPWALAVDGSGNLFVADLKNQRVQMRNPQGVWKVIASKGTAPNQVISPASLAVDRSGNLYVADYLKSWASEEEGNNRVQMRTPQGAWSVIASPGTDPDHVFTPGAMAVDTSGNLYVADYVSDVYNKRPINHRVQMRTPQGVWSIIATKGSAPNQVEQPDALVVDNSGNLFVADSSNSNSNNSRMLMRTQQGTWSVIASEGTAPDQVGHPNALAVDTAGNLFVGDEANRRVQLRTPQGFWSVLASSGDVEALAADNTGYLYVADQVEVQMRTPREGWSIIASNGSDLGQINYPLSMTADASDNLFVADVGTNPGNSSRIQMRTPQGVWSVIASNGSNPEQVLSPNSMTTDASGNLYVADWNNRRVQMRTPQGVWSVIASTGTAPDQVIEPTFLTVDGAGRLYVGDTGNHRVQRYSEAVGPPAGDLDCDGSVTLRDATLALQIAVGLSVPTAAQKTAGDLNEDAVLDLKDVTLILRKAVGL